MSQPNNPQIVGLQHRRKSNDQIEDVPPEANQMRGIAMLIFHCVVQMGLQLKRAGNRMLKAQGNPEVLLGSQTLRQQSWELSSRWL